MEAKANIAAQTMQTIQIVKFQQPQESQIQQRNSEDLATFQSLELQQKDRPQQPVHTLMESGRHTLINSVLRMELGHTFQDRRIIRQEKQRQQQNMLTISLPMELLIVVLIIHCKETSAKLIYF